MRWSLLVLFAALPLQWFVVPLPMGILRLHILALIVFTILTLVKVGPDGIKPVTSRCRPFVAAFLCLIAFAFAADIYHGRSPRDSIDLAVLLTGALAVSAVVRRAVRGNSHALDSLRWCGPVCLASLLSALSFSLWVNGVDAAAVVGQAIGHADPLILQRELYAPAFAGFGLNDETVKSQLRHEIFAALLLATYVSFAASSLRPLRSRTAFLVLAVATAVSVVLIAASLSRAVTIAAMAWPLLALWRRISSGNLPTGSIVTALAILVGGALLTATGLLSVVWARFTQDTTSYEGRDGLLKQAMVNIQNHWLVGGVETVGESSHNFVLDYWLRSGIFAAAGAAFVLVGLIGLLARMMVRLPGEPAWMVSALAVLFLVLVRMFTAGGGAIPPVEWVALGVVAGVMTARADAQSPHENSVHSAPSDAQLASEGPVTEVLRT